MDTLFYDTFTDGEDYIAASTDKGLAYVGLAKDADVELPVFFKGYRFVQDAPKNEEAVRQLKEYFTGNRHSFDLPLDMKGTDFQKSVWQQLLRIPFGQVQTYSQLAQNIKNEKGVRAVANAVGRNPLMIVVPCHRVIGKNGRLTGFRGGVALKKRLLEHEGVLHVKD